MLHTLYIAPCGFLDLLHGNSLEPFRGPHAGHDLFPAPPLLPCAEPAASEGLGFSVCSSQLTAQAGQKLFGDVILFSCHIQNHGSGEIRFNLRALVYAGTLWKNPLRKPLESWAWGWEVMGKGHPKSSRSGKQKFPGLLWGMDFFLQCLRVGESERQADTSAFLPSL